MTNRMQIQITSITNTVKSLQMNLSLTAMDSDGRIDREEEKVLKKVNAATEKYIKELQKIK